MKVRIAEVSKGYVPQVFIPSASILFRSGGDWQGILKVNNEFFAIKSLDVQLEKCCYLSRREAEKVLEDYLVRREDRKALQ